MSATNRMQCAQTRLWFTITVLWHELAGYRARECVPQVPSLQRFGAQLDGLVWSRRRTEPSFSEVVQSAFLGTEGFA